jgi:cadmium resistance protein CadD (predicted permease)
VLVGWQTLRGQQERERGPGEGRAGAIAVAAVTIANGADNMAAYVPFFASREVGELAGVAAVFAALTALWCVAAFWLVHHPTLGAPLRKYGAALLPIVLIVVGLTIFFEARTHELLAEAWR